MPHVFAQLPFPKASLAVLETFMEMAGLDIDVTELREQARTMDSKLEALYAQVEQATDQQQEAKPEWMVDEEPADEDRLNPEDRARVERLFEQAAEDRSKAYELKSEMDRLGIFEEYEDRFLDLFKKTD